jgi:hypothetical protein
MLINKKQRESKTQLAKKLGVSRASLYYKGKRDKQDEEMRKQILIVLGMHPSYGHKRIALEFSLNNKRIRRAMKKYDMKPYRRRAKRLRKKEKRPQSGKTKLLLFVQSGRILSGLVILPTLNLWEVLSIWQQSLIFIQERLSALIFP